MYTIIFLTRSVLKQANLLVFFISLGVCFSYNLTKQHHTKLNTDPNLQLCYHSCFYITKKEDSSMRISVCDAIMGKGKTQSAITMMNENPDRRFIFVTPFLDEANRICNACPERNFVQPTVYSSGNKLDCLNKYLKEGKNIASTHALFYRYNEETLRLAREGGYTLILDETIDVVDFLGITGVDVNLLFNNRIIDITEGGRVIRKSTDYSGIFNSLLNELDDSFVTCENDRLLVWKMPLDFFACFEDVIILTYLFEVQPQYYYFKMHGVDINYIGTEYTVLPGIGTLTAPNYRPSIS